MLTGDSQRSRLTVLFRLLLAVPHLIWLLLWSLAATFVVICNWVMILATRRAPAEFHRFVARFVRYGAHVYAYLTLAANPFPPFGGRAGTYPFDVEIDEAAPQSRAKTFFRLLLAIPALMLLFVLGSGGGGGSTGQRGGDDPVASGVAFYGGLMLTAALLAWFACLVRGAMPLGLRGLLAYVLHYAAQVYGYLLLLTDRYPDSDPYVRGVAVERDDDPIRAHLDEDLRRSRLTVFFRFLLFLPHMIWGLLWSVPVLLAVIVNWLVLLVAGRPVAALHRFVARYLRYWTQILSFLYLVTNAFPGFTGEPGRYPFEVLTPPPERQHRAKTAFRLILAFPGLLLAGALSNALGVVALLGWFASLVTGRMPRGLRNLGGFGMRYSAQWYGYLLLLTDRYPFSGPVIGEIPPVRADAPPAPPAPAVTPPAAA